MTQVQEKSNSTETHLSGCKRKNETADAGDQQSVNKYQRFWARKWWIWKLMGRENYLCTLHKSMAADISPKDIKDKKISLHPVSNNIKDSRKLDEFIKELLVEKKN